MSFKALLNLQYFSAKAMWRMNLILLINFMKKYVFLLFLRHIQAAHTIICGGLYNVLIKRSKVALKSWLKDNKLDSANLTVNQIILQITLFRRPSLQSFGKYH